MGQSAPFTAAAAFLLIGASPGTGGCAQQPEFQVAAANTEPVLIPDAYSVRMFPRGDTAISGLWIEPSPLADPSSPGSPGAAKDPRQEPIAYVVQDSNVNPAAVAVFGLGDPTGPKLRGSLAIADPKALIAAACARALAEASWAGSAVAPGNESPANADGLSLDMEGIAACSEGVKLEANGTESLAYGREFWVVCEGKGRLVDGTSEEGKDRFRRPNLLIKLTPHGQGLNVSEVIELPEQVRKQQEAKGFEGVAVGPKGRVYVAFQRGWERAGDHDGFTRLGRFDPKDGSWAFAHYALDPYPIRTGSEDGRGSDPPDEVKDAWVGISELTSSPGGGLLVLERDNRRGDFARVQRIYTIDVEGLSFRNEAPFSVASKELVFDLIEKGVHDPRYSAPIRKPEALGVLGPNELLLIADDDGKRGSKKGTPFFVLRTQ